MARGCWCSVRRGSTLNTPTGNWWLPTVSIQKMRQADRQTSRSFAYVGGRSLLTDKPALSPGSKSQADMSEIWGILQAYCAGVSLGCGMGAQLSIIGAVLLLGCWAGCALLPQTWCLQMARRQQLRQRREPCRCIEAWWAGWQHAPPQPLAVPPTLHFSIPLSCPLGCPLPSHQCSSSCQQMPSGTYSCLKPLWWKHHRLGQSLVYGQAVGGLPWSQAGQGRGTIRCAQGMLKQPGFTTTFKFFHV